MENGAAFGCLFRRKFDSPAGDGGSGVDQPGFGIWPDKPGSLPGGHLGISNINAKPRPCLVAGRHLCPGSACRQTWHPGVSIDDCAAIDSIFEVAAASSGLGLQA